MSSKITKTALALINRGPSKTSTSSRPPKASKQGRSTKAFSYAENYAPIPSPAEVSTLVMARVSHERYNNIIKVAVPKHRLNEHLWLYRRVNDNFQVYDEKNICKPGDWILIRREENISPNVNHRVEKVVYPYGNYVDPITNRRSLGIYYDDDIEKLEAIKIDN